MENNNSNKISLEDTLREDLLAKTITFQKSQQIIIGSTSISHSMPQIEVNQKQSYNESINSKKSAELLVQSEKLTPKNKISDIQLVLSPKFYEKKNNEEYYIEESTSFSPTRNMNKEMNKSTNSQTNQINNKQMFFPKQLVNKIPLFRNEPQDILNRSLIPKENSSDDILQNSLPNQLEQRNSGAYNESEASSILSSDPSHTILQNFNPSKKYSSYMLYQRD